MSAPTTTTLPPKKNRVRHYETLLEQIRALTEGETDPTANMANITAALKTTFRFHWIGFYLVKGGELVLGPFQGPVACTRIALGKGVCGTAWKEAQAQIVPDVKQFPGHIACSAESRSEIVVPLIRDGAVTAVLDIDSKWLYDFDATDAKYLRLITDFL